MKRVLRFATSDGEQWDLPKEIPATHRAKYYAEKDKDTTFDAEFTYAMEDDYEAIDWLQNNMNPEEYEAHLIFVSGPDEKPFLEKFSEDDRRRIDEVKK